MNVLFTYELARRTAGTNVTCNCVHPAAGMFATAATAAARAVGPLFLATSTMLEDVSGKYFVGMKEAKSADVSYDSALAGNLWKLSTQLVGPNAAAQPTPSITRSRFLARNPAFS